jgi:hypothetical protein
MAAIEQLIALEENWQPHLFKIIQCDGSLLMRLSKIW